MANITIVVPAEAVTTIEDAIAAKFGYVVADGTKAEFLAATLRAWLKAEVCAHLAGDAGATARAAEAATIAALIA